MTTDTHSQIDDYWRTALYAYGRAFPWRGMTDVSADDWLVARRRYADRRTEQRFPEVAS